MYHFFVEKEQVGEQLVTITGPDVNHIKNVLRMKPVLRVHSDKILHYFHLY